MKIFITGAGGFLGRFLKEALLKQGHDLVAPSSRDCDLLQQKSLSKYDSLKFDRIYHLAAWTQAGDFCLRHPGEQWLVNQAINTNVLDWWHHSQPQAKLVSMGTSCSYDPEVQLSEMNYLSGTPIDSLFTYAMTKRMLYVGQLALNKQYGHSYLHIVPSTLYGPNYHHDGRQMHFIFDLMRKILRGKKEGSEVVLWGDGHQKRELVYVKDFVRLLLQLDEQCSNELVNIGAGTEYTIREFANIICKIVGYDAQKIKYDTSKYVGAKSKCLDVTKLRTLVPGLQFQPLDQGLEKTVTWLSQVIS